MELDGTRMEGMSGTSADGELVCETSGVDDC